jgi:neutral trehalase
VRRELNQERLKDLEDLRTEAIAEYDAIKQECWKRLKRCPAKSNAAVGYIGSIVEARKQQDRLLGLEQVTIDHRIGVLAKIDAMLDVPVPFVLPGGRDDAA